MGKVLVACEESQRVCIAFRNKGHIAYSCDIQDCSGNKPEWHIKDNVLNIMYDSRWDLVLAFPPCTHISVAGTRWFKQKQADGRQQQGIDFFMKFTELKCKWMIENPVGIMNTLYRKPDQIIHPYQFGDTFQKRTCLWLKDLPKLVPTKIVSKGEFITYKKKGGTVQNYPKWFYDCRWRKDRSKIRSKTFPGIAKAMSEQWGNLI